MSDAQAIDLGVGVPVQSEPEPTAPPDQPPAGRSRAKLLLLTVLAAAAVALLLFTAWYLVLRKPISELPLPAITTEQVPSYAYSFYGPKHPTGVAVSSDGSRIYATQTDADPLVFILDRQGNEVGRIAPPPDSAGLHVFVYVAVNPKTGEVYVSDRPAGAIWIYSADGTFERPFPVPESLAGWQPLGLNFDAAGDLFVTDAGAGRVHEFDPTSALQRTITGQSPFSFPNAAVADTSGRIYVADSNNGRVVVLDPQGAQIAVLRRGPGAGDLGLPRGMAQDDEGRLYVVDATDQSVKLYRPAGDPNAAPTYIGSFGTDGADGGLQYPNAVATDARGRVYVADWENDRVQIWTY